MNTTLKKIKNAIVSGYKPDKIILFGSRVWGKPTKWSDYDLFILKKGERRSALKRGMEVKKIMRDKKISVSTDVLVYNASELQSIIKDGSQLFQDIVTIGKKLYEKR